MESSSDSDQEISANMVLMAKMEKVLLDSEESSLTAEETIVEVSYYTFDSESESEYETSEYYDNSTNYGLFVDNDDDQEIFHDANESASENFNENNIVSQTDHDEYSTLYDNDKQHRKKIDKQEILFDKMSSQLVEMNNNMLRLQEKILEKQTKISELEECVRNKDLEIEKCLERLNDYENKLHKIRQTRQTIHMIMPSKDNMYNGRKGIGFENPSYFCKAKEWRPSLYDERVIGLGYTLMFLTQLDEALEIEKFKRARERKIEFAYDYGNLNESYVNEKINFLDDYFQEIINLDFEKIDSLFQQISSLKTYVPTVILEKIIINLEDEVVSLLEKEKEKLEIIESLKSKGFKSSENAISELEKQNENDCQVVKKSCDNLENSKVIAPGMFKINVSQSVSPISVLYASYDVNDLFVFDDIVQICLWIIDSRCSKHMTGNRALLTNFVENFLGTVRFGNNDFAVIASYGDVVIRSMKIKKVYYVKDGVDLLTGDRSSNLYTIVLNDIALNSLAYLLAKASSSQSWFWHQRLSHLNFATINNLVKNNLVQGTRQQNGILERRNQTLVEAARTMLTFANLPLCYLLNDYDDVGKLNAKGDIGVFVGYSKESATFRIYNKCTRKMLGI
ncbi:retrovirus-related pol polyprotein from transposon TNT 1-94 [Tanacetum coccineum]